MILLGYDSITPSAIPPDPPVVFPYDDGAYKWDHTLFPNAKYKTITVLGNLKSDIADVERYDLTVNGGIQWGRTKYSQLHQTPTLYSSVDNLGALAAGMAGTPHYFWVADPGKLHMYSGVPGVIATQCIYNGNYDVSAVDSNWFSGGTNPNMATPTAPCIGGRITPTGKGYWLVGADGGVFAQGDAKFFGSAFGKLTNEHIVGFDIAADGTGYILWSDQYHAFAFGSCTFEGNPF